MLACTLLTTIAFANNDTLNKIANDNAAFFYPKAVLENKTQMHDISVYLGQFLPEWPDMTDLI